MMQLVTKSRRALASVRGKARACREQLSHGADPRQDPAVLTETGATLSLDFEQGLTLTGRQLVGDGKFIRLLGLCHEQNSKSCISFILDF